MALTMGDVKDIILVHRRHYIHYLLLHSITVFVINQSVLCYARISALLEF
jgi:hypothetical protein